MYAGKSHQDGMSWKFPVPADWVPLEQLWLLFLALALWSINLPFFTLDILSFRALED
jgi:hypothetical protein